MDIDPTLTRRSALAAGLAGAGALTLAACSSSGGSGGSGSTATRDPKAAAGGSTAVPGPASGSGSTGAGAGSGTGGTPLAELDKITVGQAVSATLDGKPVIVSRPTADTAACFSAICTHMGCTVAPAGTQLHCPCHGSVFDTTTGKVVSGPAPSPLPSVQVKVVNGEVVPD